MFIAGCSLTFTIFRLLPVKTGKPLPPLSRIRFMDEMNAGLKIQPLCGLKNCQVALYYQRMPD
jgi:hypothetical protein